MNKHFLIAASGTLVAVAVLVFVFLLGGGSDSRRDGDPPSLLDQLRLRSLGYLTEVPAGEESQQQAGVTKYDPEAAYPGLNFFNTLGESQAKLMAMDGRVVHRWSSTERGRTYSRYREFFPSSPLKFIEGWSHVELLAGGDLLAIGSHHMLLRLDSESRVKWMLDLSAHHDLSVAPNGEIFVITDAIRTTQVDGEVVAFLDNQLAVVTPDGELVRRISLFDLLNEGGWARRLRRRLNDIKPARDRQIQRYRAAAPSGRREDSKLLRLYEEAVKGSIGEEGDVMNLLFHNGPEDIFHTNSVQVLDRASPGLWQEGDILLTIRNLQTIAVINPRTMSLGWTWGRNELQFPHHATHLPDGNVLIFDNGIMRGYSRIVSVDPKERRIVWQYKADPPESFFSRGRGGCQKLPNGNVLVADTDSGRAFEVTPDGKVVWEFYTKIRTGVGKKAKRGAIYRMTRVESSEFEDLLPSLSAPRRGRAGQRGSVSVGGDDPSRNSESLRRARVGTSEAAKPGRAAFSR